MVTVMVAVAGPALQSYKFHYKFGDTPITNCEEVINVIEFLDYRFGEKVRSHK